jgi:Aldo/keto reductase family
MGRRPALTNPGHDHNRLGQAMRRFHARLIQGITKLKQGERMNYRSFGRTGMKVSPYCLGAMMFGAGGNPDHDECIRIVHKALDAGINFIDTADAYTLVIVGQRLTGEE